MANVWCFQVDLYSSLRVTITEKQHSAVFLNIRWPFGFVESIGGICIYVYKIKDYALITD